MLAFQSLTILNLTLTTPLDFNYAECLRFLNRNEDECLHRVVSEEVFSSVCFGGKVIPFSVKYCDNGFHIETINDLNQQALNALQLHIEEWFDLKRDLSPFYKLLEANERLTPLLQLKGLRIMGIPNLFEALCWSVIDQQINLNFAFKLKRRLVETYGVKTSIQDQVIWQFPTPESLLTIDEAFQKGNQFSRSKVAYIRNLGEAFATGKISKQILTSLNTFEERQTLLTSVKGIGEWSANYALMKCMHEPNAIPFGDTGLTQALFNLGLITDRKNRKQVEDFFGNVKGWESYTTFYLWHSLLS